MDSPIATAQPVGHRLSALLAPQSIVLVGASPKTETVGNGMIRSVTGGRYRGRVYLVNPGYKEIGGQVCYPSIADLPETVDHAVLALANTRIERAVADAITAGVRAATLFGSLYIEGDTEPKLTQRIAARAREAGMAICGANGMGFYNFDHGLRVCGFPPPDWVQGGGSKALISHSGSVFSALVHNDRRFTYNLAVSPGQELGATADEYLDYALEMPTTRVVGLFLETIRNPQGFVAALDKAKRKDIPLVALKVGRTEESAKLAVSHSGAVAGNHAAYRALFDRYGVIEVDNLDEFANALLFFGHDRQVGAGGIASMHDSGGERELLVDQAIAKGVPFGKINEITTERLRARLDYGLDPVNPLDAWGTGHDYEGIFADCMTALCQDPDVALGALFVETRSGKELHYGYARIMSAAAAQTEKPVLFVNNLAAPGDDALTIHMNNELNLPVLIGIDAALTVFKKAFERRDAKTRGCYAPPPPPPGVRAKWRVRLETGIALDEAESLKLMWEYGIPTLAHRRVGSLTEARAAGVAIGYPVALKTATPGILHKSDVGGVKLGLKDEASLDVAYADLAARLGPEALVMAMAEKGVELSFGAVVDPQFGPLVMIGAGGLLIELMKDRRFLLPPVDTTAARHAIDQLALRPLLDGVRGQPAANVPALSSAFANFTIMVDDLGDLIAEIDINPILAGPKGVVALDGLIQPAQKKG